MWYRPSYKVQIGSETFEAGSLSVISIHTSLSMEIPADSCEILFGTDSKSSKIQEGDEILIQLGYEDRLGTVFKGLADNVEHGISVIRVLGLNLISKFFKTKVNQVYEDQPAGKIVSDLTEKAGLKVEEASNGLRFPLYVVDDRRDVYKHIRDLAEKCGFNSYMTVENKLVFKKYGRKEPHVFEYGKNVIEIEADRWEPPFASIQVQGESPASFKGADTSHWLTKREVKGSAGRGNALLIEDPTVRDGDTAQKVAKARLDALMRSLSGTVKTLGEANVKLGDTIELRGMERSEMNGEYQVRSVEHVLNRIEGFVTFIGWRKY